MIYSLVLLYYHIMSRKRIPKEKIEEAMVFWLLGDSARIAAKKASISKNVLLEHLRKRPDAEILIEKLHVVVRRLKKEGLDVLSYMEIIRTRNFLKETGLDEKYILTFMSDLAYLAYYFFRSPNELAKIMIDFGKFREEGGWKTPMQLVEYLKKQKNYLEKVREEAAEFDAAANEAFQRQVRTNINAKYLKTDPAIPFKMSAFEEEIKELKDKLAAKDRELGEFRRQTRLPKIYITRDIAEGEAECLSKKLKRIVRRDEIYEKAQDIIRHPSKYAHLFHKPDLPPSLDPHSAENARVDGNDANGI
jgi:hypothetical protein